MLDYCCESFLHLVFGLLMLSGERNATDGWTPDEQLHFCVSDSKLIAFKGLWELWGVYQLDTHGNPSQDWS